MVICLDRQERVHATEKKYADVTLGAVKSLCESFVRLAFRLRILDTSLITVFPMHTKLFLALLALALPLSMRRTRKFGHGGAKLSYGGGVRESDRRS